MPEKTLKQLVNMTRYYEVDNLKDLEENWDDISQQKQVPFSVLAWFGREALKQGKENPRLMEEMKEKNTSVKADFEKLLGDDRREIKHGLLSKLSGGKFDLPTTPACSLYLNAVKLEKIKSLDNDSFTGSEYEITDVRGNKIRAIHVRESIMNDMFENQSAKPNDTRDKIDMMRLDPRPAVVVCSPLNTKHPALQIVKVQSGGKSIAPEMPTIGI
jgi:hypothetical protein